jgi:5-(carboxyamino)imidazole ribonucleotide synthase
MKTLGIVGGGQLARMLTDAAHALGFSVIVLDPTPNSPGGQVADEQILGSFTDAEKIRELSEKVDFLTFEIESADNEALATVAKQKPVNPAPDTLSIIKDKYAQKVFLKTHGIATADFLEIKSIDDAKEAGSRFGYPFVLKAKRDSYDGKGNALVEAESGIDDAFQKLVGRELYAEKFVPFTKELAVVAARSNMGDIALFPLVETVHVDHICDTVTMPAGVSENVRAEAEQLARNVMEHLSGAGVFAIEMFLGESVVVNEIAPRVHNSGHLTIESCETSQFEQHVRAVTGMPLGKTDMKVPAAVMLNILGKRNGPAEPKGFEEVGGEPNTFVHLYGKHETREGRKMGHVTVTGLTEEEAHEKAEKIRHRVSI